MDDIAFQTGRCEAIPWQGKSLEGGNPFELHDGQMKGTLFVIAQVPVDLSVLSLTYN